MNSEEFTLDDSDEKYRYIEIDGDKTFYAVSETGKVFNTKRKKFIKGNPKKRRINHALEDEEPNNMYIEYALYFNKKYYYKLAHRLVAEAFIPVPDKYIMMGLTQDDLVVDHKDNVRYHNEISNLQWLTGAENHDKMMKMERNRNAYGSKHGMCNYTEDQLNLVGKLFEENILTKKEISEATGIPYKTICSIYTGKKFSYLHELYDFSKYNRHQRNYYDIDVIIMGFVLLADDHFSMRKISQLTGINYSFLKDMIHGRAYKNIRNGFDLSYRLKIDTD